MDITVGIEELVQLQRQTLARLSAGPAELLDVDGVAALLGVAQKSVWTMSKNGDFPSPIDVGVDVTRWRRAEILAWIAKRKPRKRAKRSTHETQ